ncbi:aldolase catalytic domain-containing protein [Thiomicrorhabdus xiamenensis]|uniref:Homocitrate synthase n=1 Tax=Thiomicrorhabdus xiamenensis TaxID=2739063 RepID=A0A7D4NM17_9GAMM|nr:aldolase catalytic domain-containing protein [Thiomicrorhabdus xiamenensis]QKI89774.1 aldolase [Thiomicrorhabdus xiamenensis]
MDALGLDYVEIGFRSLKNNGFKGPYAFSQDGFLKTLPIPDGLKSKIGVMVNGSELSDPETQLNRLKRLFTPKKDSPISLVRIACHVHEFKACLPISAWLKEQGYIVGFNLMQVADRSVDEIANLAREACGYPIDVLYFADSMGSLDPKQTCEIVRAFQQEWKGHLGIHTHDNMNQAIANTLASINAGVTWVDSTVTGMGRGPGNAQTEFLAMAIKKYPENAGNPTKLFEVIRSYFKPLQAKYGWGTNPYYYLAGQYGIHPSYIQEMLQDARYSDEDMIAVIEHLRVEGGKKFSLDTLEAARHFYSGEQSGSWSPKEVLAGRDVLVVGSGPSVKDHKLAIEKYIKCYRPYVIALNTESSLDQELVCARAACHPVRLLADCHQYSKLSQPLITPYSMLPEDVQNELSGKPVFDFGLYVEKDQFVFDEFSCVLPNSLVFSYVLAIANSGGAKKIHLVGFDGYSADDPRSREMEHLLQLYKSFGFVSLSSLTPTRYDIPTQSIYGF